MVGWLYRIELGVMDGWLAYRIELGVVDGWLAYRIGLKLLGIKVHDSSFAYETDQNVC